MEVSEAASENVTVPGPLTLDQVVVSIAGGLGNPSSLAVPLRLADAGSVIEVIWWDGGLMVCTCPPGSDVCVHLTACTGASSTSSRGTRYAS